jgi:hypothetical protein
VTTFSPNSAPSLLAPFSGHIGRAAIDPPATNGGCSCSHFQLSNTFPASQKITPFWTFSPGWSEEWDVAETRREEQRRLVWNALTLTSGLLAYYDSADHTSLNLSLTKPWNVGEPHCIVCFRTDISSPSSKFSSRVRNSLGLHRCKMTSPRNTPYGHFMHSVICCIQVASACIMTRVYPNTIKDNLQCRRGWNPSGSRKC